MGNDVVPWYARIPLPFCLFKVSRRVICSGDRQGGIKVVHLGRENGSGFYFILSLSSFFICHIIPDLHEWNCLSKIPFTKNISESRSNNQKTPQSFPLPHPHPITNPQPQDTSAHANPQNFSAAPITSFQKKTILRAGFFLKWFV